MFDIERLSKIGHGLVMVARRTLCDQHPLGVDIKLA